MKKSVRLMALAAGLSLGGAAFGDADIAVQPAGTATEATTNVDICVIVPEILIFQVGEQKDNIAKLRWTFSAAGGYGTGNNQSYAGNTPVFTAPAPFDGAPIVDVPTNGSGSSTNGAAEATLPVFLFSNNGSDVTITTKTTGGPTGGGLADQLVDANAANTTTIAIGQFTQGQSGSIIHPGLASGSTADTAHTAGIVNLKDEWTYEYIPTSIPVAGKYEARITYTAAQP